MSANPKDMPILNSNFMESRHALYTGKTHAWEIMNKSSREVLGLVKWYSPWRQYCFLPADACLFNKDCLISITQFISDAMLYHKSKPESMTT